VTITYAHDIPTPFACLPVSPCFEDETVGFISSMNFGLHPTFAELGMLRSVGSEFYPNGFTSCKKYVSPWNYFITSFISVYVQANEGLSFEVLPLNSYAFSPPMLQLLETFSEFVLWNSFQCRHIF